MSVTRLSLLNLFFPFDPVNLLFQLLLFFHQPPLISKSLRTPRPPSFLILDLLFLLLNLDHNPVSLRNFGLLMRLSNLLKLNFPLLFEPLYLLQLLKILLILLLLLFYLSDLLLLRMEALNGALRSHTFLLPHSFDPLEPSLLLGFFLPLLLIEFTKKDFGLLRCRDL